MKPFGEWVMESPLSSDPPAMPEYDPEEDIVLCNGCGEVFKADYDFDEDTIHYCNGSPRCCP